MSKFFWICVLTRLESLPDELPETVDNLSKILISS